MMKIFHLFLNQFFIFCFLLCTSAQSLPKSDPAFFKAVPIPSSLTKKKTWNFIVYMAANNNLHSFALKNINQAMSVGSNDAVNIIVQIDGLPQKKVKRYYVKKNELVTLGENDSNSPEVLPSGSSASLYNLIEWSINNFPADYQAVVLWNHGSGIKDPSMWGRNTPINRDELFILNEKTGQLSLRHNTYKEKDHERGIAFNDAYKQYLTNKDLSDTLEKIKNGPLAGKNIDAVFFDACHMGMIEIAYQLQNSVSYMSGSAEVEPGAGYNYATLLSGCKQGMTPQQFTQHVTKMYGKEYNNSYGCLTQVAVDLQAFKDLKPLWQKLSQTLIQHLKETSSNNKFSSFLQQLKELRADYNATTEYSDADYIDIGHFLQSLQTLFNQQKNSSSHLFNNEMRRIGELKTTIQSLYNQINSSVIIESSCGSDLSNACGLGLYFPKYYVHGSYPKTMFDKDTNWSTFLQTYFEKTKNV